MGGSLAVMHGWKWEPFSGNFLPPHFLGILTPVDIPSYKLGSVPCEKPYGQLTSTRVVLFFQKLQFLPGVSHFPASVKFSSVAQSCPTLCNPIDCSTPGIPVYRQLPEFTQTHVHWVSGATNHLILCLPLLLLPSIFPSIRAFSNESTLLIRWPKDWSFSFSIRPSNEYSGLISFRMDWLDLLAVQGTLRSLLQHHSSEASVPQHSAFFIVQLSHPYLTTGKTIALTRRTFGGKVMSLLLSFFFFFSIYLY